jgi:hypothetical protein
MRLLVTARRGRVEADPWHVGWGATRKAAGDSDQWLDVLEVTVCMNSRKAPNKQNAFLGQLKSVRDEFFSPGRTTSDPHFGFIDPLHSVGRV